MVADLTTNARIVLEHRYLLKDVHGRVVETPEEMFRRVARVIAEADRDFEGSDESARLEEAYFEAMSRLHFLPNSPTLMNAGTRLGQLAACFVLPVRDSIPSIFGAVRNAAIIHQSGGGTGFSFSRLRPRGDPVRETGGVASGPVSFMRVFDTATDVVKQGGRRRGANMGVLAINHPDILEFVTAKNDPAALTNFNLSVAVSEAFMTALAGEADWPLINPRTRRRVGTIPARQLWRTICESAWLTGEPGLLFIDEINRHNPTPALGPIEATNPCGEQPLLPYEPCNLGSINLARLVENGRLDWTRLERLAHLAVRFLDNVIDVSRYPLPQIRRLAHANRKIGLGVMGFAEALIALGVPYDSPAAFRLAEQIMSFISARARIASAELAARRGPFPNYAQSVHAARGVPLRNATLTTIAPTGTISVIAGTSSGIEPIFALAYTRLSLDGIALPERNRLLVAELERRKLPVEPILDEVATTGSIQNVAGVPAAVRRLFKTALDLSGESHVRMQAAFQRHTDNGVSKTVNLPESATPEGVSAIFDLAWRLRCKGITIFRIGSRDNQVLHLGKVPAFVTGDGEARAHGEFAGECRICSV